MSKGVPKGKDKSRKDQIIDVLFDALPATTRDEITAYVKRRIPGITLHDVDKAMSHLRKNTEKYGWTVPHVGGDSTKKNRYFALLVERDGTYHFDDSPESRGHLQDGSRSMVNRIATESDNQATMLKVGAAHERSRAKRALLLELCMDCEYVARKAAALAKSMSHEDDSGRKAA